jgi:hypothetical protein
VVFNEHFFPSNAIYRYESYLQHLYKVLMLLRMPLNVYLEILLLDTEVILWYCFFKYQYYCCKEILLKFQVMLLLFHNMNFMERDFSSTSLKKMSSYCYSQVNTPVANLSLRNFNVGHYFLLSSHLDTTTLWTNPSRTSDWNH